MPHVKAGKLRVIAVGTPQRIATLPDVPTVAEQGYPGFETSQWYGLNVPAKTPDATVKRLADDAAQAAKSPAVLERFETDDAIAVGSTPPSSPRTSRRNRLGGASPNDPRRRRIEAR